MAAGRRAASRCAPRQRESAGTIEEEDDVYRVTALTINLSHELNHLRLRTGGTGIYTIVVVVVVFICVGEDFLEKKHLPYTNVVVVVVLSAYQGREI